MSDKPIGMFEFERTSGNWTPTNADGAISYHGMMLDRFRFRAYTGFDDKDGKAIFDKDTLYSEMDDGVFDVERKPSGEWALRHCNVRQYDMTEWHYQLTHKKPELFEREGTRRDAKLSACSYQSVNEREVANLDRPKRETRRIIDMEGNETDETYICVTPGAHKAIGRRKGPEDRRGD